MKILSTTTVDDHSELSKSKVGIRKIKVLSVSETYFYSCPIHKKKKAFNPACKLLNQTMQYSQI